MAGSKVYGQQTLTKSFLHNGVIRAYILYVPASYRDGSAAPLVFNFHGFGMTALGEMNYCDFRPVADTAGFILVHPQGTPFNGSNHWNVGGWTNGSTADDIGFTNAMIDSISSIYSIDLSRVYSTGFSNGGFFSFELACQLSNRMPETYAHCHPTRPVPVIQIHGTNDFTVSYTGMSWSEPVPVALSYWINFNHTDTTPAILRLPDLNTSDGSTVEKYTYSNGDSCSSVEHYKVIGGGHDWPGSWGNMDINSGAVIWKFLSRYRLTEGNTVGTGTDFPVEKITIYPNPATSRISIKSAGIPGKQYEIITTSGVTVINGMFKQEMEEIDLTPIAAGIYYLRIENQLFRIMKIK